MNTTDSFDRHLSAWLQEEAQGRVSDHLAEVLVHTRSTRQRPGWASLERWLPVTSIALARSYRLRPALPILLVLALLIAALTAFALFQAGRPTVPKFGEAANGRIVFVDGDTIRSVAVDGSDPRTVVAAPAPNAPAISPDGDLVAYAANGDHLEIARLASTNGETSSPIAVTSPGIVAYGLPAWSPNGELVAFTAADEVGDHAFIANRDGTNVHLVGGDAVEPGYGIAWLGFSPNGRWLAIADGQGEAPDGQLLLVDLSGGTFRILETASISFDDGSGIAWSPDPSTPRILYLAKSGGTRYYDLTTDEDIAVAGGFWPSWSPTGDRISYWSNGTKVITTPTPAGGTGVPLEIFASFGDACQDHPEMAGKAFCGPVVWSPDGSRLVATEVTGSGLLSLRSDGRGQPIFIDLAVDSNPGRGGYYAWQPVMPGR